MKTRSISHNQTHNVRDSSTQTSPLSSDSESSYNDDDNDVNIQDIRKIMTDTLGKALENIKYFSDDDDEVNPKQKKICTNPNPNPNPNPNIDSYTKNEMHYFKNASDEEKNKINNMEIIISNQHQQNKNIPLRFRILNSKLPIHIKNIALQKHNLLNDIDESSNEYFKQMTWIENLLQIPFQNYTSLNIEKNNPDYIYKFLIDSKNILDNSVYGHVDAKLHILRIIAQKIANPDSKGLILGISGKPGVGKTMLVKDGICKALKYPFSFIPLGGSNDGSFLEGHSITYEGSTWGKIVDCLIKSGSMNPVLFFDELDKVSDTSKGQEIINILIHLTDPTQNDKFNDKYFNDIDFDLSRCIIIFTYNEEESINPILLDRITKINVGEFSINDKIKIASKFLIPEILTQFNLKNIISFDEDVIQFIIQNTDKEAGVRNLKRTLEYIISNINISRFINNTDISLLPNIFQQNLQTATITIDIVDTLLKTRKKNNINESLPHMYL
jgi:ATP-dependent Lon protease